MNSFAVIIFVVTYIVWTQTHGTLAKAGKYCNSQKDCHSGLQICNRDKMCECFVGGRQSRRILKLVEVCKTDTHRRKIGEKCLYSSQCNWNQTVGCMNSICNACNAGFKLDSNGVSCKPIPTTTSTTKAPLTAKEKSEKRKGTVKQIIVISSSVCTALAVFGICVAICRTKCEKVKRSKYPESIYFQGNQTRLEDKPDSYTPLPTYDYHGEANCFDPVSVASALVLPEYFEDCSSAIEKEKFTTPKADIVDENKKTCGESSAELPSLQSETEASAPEPSLWDRWLPSVEKYYSSKDDNPPPYDLNKYISTSPKS